MRKIEIANGEYYHIFNRGVDKRMLFSDPYDINRFMTSIREFNNINPIGSIHENHFKKSRSEGSTLSNPLVEIVAYCVLPNHYHFILKQFSEKGIEKFMHKLSGGYTMYFNEKHKRSGSLFQGTYKALHVNTNEYLLHLSAYVNLNNHVHKKWGGNLTFIRSSWKEYLNLSEDDITSKDIILGQFRNPNEYQNFAFESLNSIRERRELDEILELDNALEA